MFCPKCGTENPETGKFCRSCGTDLNIVSAALAGKLKSKSDDFGFVAPMQSLQPSDLGGGKEEFTFWESAISTGFVGAAFLIIAFILGVTGVAGGRSWWFWMLIPGFACLGTALARYVQLKKNEQSRKAANFAQNSPETLRSAAASRDLPPVQTNYIEPQNSLYETGELAAPPASVTETTTRHLEVNKEGETMTLPKQ